MILTEPQGYLEFLSLYSKARFVLTDSGGVQAETTVLNVPCITMRTTTEYPITLSQGTNTLVGSDTQLILAAVEKALVAASTSAVRPPMWDGATSQRIVEVLRKIA
jgi:UDP-N-acetylglucosamine 2-epimerase (non-hydrolysing)